MHICKKHILISNGRSGSTFISSTMSKILSIKFPEQTGKELLGSNSTDQRNIENPVVIADKFLKILLKKIQKLHIVDFIGNHMF